MRFLSALVFILQLQCVRKAFYPFSPVIKSILIGLGRFSIECRKTKTKVITLANHGGLGQYREPLNVAAMKSVKKSAKRVRASHDWFCF